MSIADRARQRCFDGEALWVLARREEGRAFLRALAAGSGSDAIGARFALEHVGEPVERGDLAAELLDLAALTREATE